MLLLDTCTFIWLCAKPDRLSERARSAINNTELIYLSDVSALELVLKHTAGKLQLPQTPKRFVREQCGIWRLTSLAIGQRDIFRVAELPLLHRDPFDRLLVAQALEHDLSVVSPDEHIKSYPVNVLW